MGGGKRRAHGEVASDLQNAQIDLGGVIVSLAEAEELLIRCGEILEVGIRQLRVRALMPSSNAVTPLPHIVVIRGAGRGYGGMLEPEWA